jgi:hypothetical protein
MKQVWWILCVQVIFALKALLTLDEIKRRMSGQAFKIILLDLLEEKDNLKWLGRILKTERLGIPSIITRRTDTWSRAIYEQVREFVLEDRTLQYYLLPSSEYTEAFKDDTVSADLQRNQDDRLMAGIPYDFEFVEPSLGWNALKIIDELDSFGEWRRSGLWMAAVGWVDLRNGREELIETPLHRYFGQHSKRSVFNNSLFITELFHDYAIRHSNNEETITGAVRFIYATYVDATNVQSLTGEAFDSDVVSYHAHYRVLELIMQAIREKDWPIYKIIKWLWSAPIDPLSVSNIPRVITVTSSLELIRLMMVLVSTIGYEKVEEIEFLTKVTENVLPILSDFELVESLMVALWHRPNRAFCRALGGVNIVKRLMEVPESMELSSSTVWSCFTPDEALAYSKRWHLRLMDAAPQFDRESDSVDFILSSYWLDPLTLQPPEIHGTPTKLCYELTLDRLINKIGAKIEQDSFIITKVLDDDQQDARLIRAAVNLILIMRVHFDVTYGIDPEIIRRIVCRDAVGNFTTFMARSQKRYYREFRLIYGFQSCHMNYLW